MALNPSVLTTLATAKDELGITDASKDGVLERQIHAASDAIRGFCHRDFARRIFGPSNPERVAGHGRPLLVLSLTPILSVEKITVEGVLQDPATYFVDDPDAGFVRLNLGVWPWTGLTQPGITGQKLPDSERPAILVEYTGGYVTPEQARADPLFTRDLPHDLEEACIFTIATWYRQRGTDLNRVQLAGAGMTQTWTRHALPVPVQEMLAPWRRVV